MNNKRITQLKRKTIIAAVFFAVAFSSFFTDSITAEAKTVDVVAHRGYSAVYPENTLTSFQAAIDAGAQNVEFDIRKTADGVMVIYHDDSVSRLVGKKTKKGVVDYTYEDLMKLDASAYLGEEFAGEQIPTLDQTLELFKDTDTTLFIELKDIGDDEDFPAQVYYKCKEYGLLDRTVFVSFKYAYLEGIKELNYSQPTMKLAAFGRPNIARKFPADYYGINMKSITPAVIKMLHDDGAKVYSYTPDDRNQMIGLQRMGVDGIITDYANANDFLEK